MAKKIKITENQLKVIVNHIRENTEPELIEEGVKEWVLVGLMTLAGAAGVKAQDTTDIKSDYVKAAKMVQDMLEAGDSTIVPYFNKADIELNKQNLQKLLKVSDDRIDKMTSPNIKTVRHKMKKGWVVSDIKIERDTLIKELPPKTTLDTTITVDLTGNLFDVGKFELSSETAGDLNDIIETIKMNNGKINSITIKSSTDKQRISPQLEPKLVKAFGKGGNEGLSNLRNNKVKEYLTSIGVDSSLIKQDVKWEQGKGEVGAETPQDPSARYVIVVIDVTYDVEVLDGDDTVIEVTEKVYYNLINKGDKKGTKRSRGSSGSGSGSFNVDKCTFNSDGKPILCPKKF